MSWIKESSSPSDQTSVWGQIINREPFQDGLNRLRVGTERESVLFIVKIRWVDDSGTTQIEQYDFKDDKLSGVSSAVQPKNFVFREMGALIEEDLLGRFMQLGQTVPSIAGSLGRCVGGLLIPDPASRRLIKEI